MNTNTVFSIVIKISELCVSIAFFIVTWKTLISLYGKKEAVFNRINESYIKSGTMSYKKLQLSRRGIMYRTKNYDLSPGYYIILKFGVGVLIGILFYFMFSDIKLLMVGMVVGYVGVPMYFKYEDGKDNEEMLMDIYNTYSNIKIQMTAGIYIRECLEYTYDMTVNKRYREALAELILNFSDKTVSSADAVNIFKNRFHSSEIDKLSALLGSFMQYGMNANHTADIMAEIQGIIQAETMKTEHDIETKTGLINFAFFGVIIAMVVYTIFSSFSIGGLL